jgi:TldD protein
MRKEGDRKIKDGKQKASGGKQKKKVESGEAVFPRLRAMLSKIDADYADLRYEIKGRTMIAFEGKELTEISANTTDGYVLRVLKNGGFSSVSFTKESDGERALRTAVGNAELISRHIRNPVILAETEVVKGDFLLNLDEDPRRMSIDEKLDLTRRYNELPLKHEKIATTSIGYLEVTREKYFLSTEGTEIREDLVTTRVGGGITSRDGSLIQTVRVGLGGSRGFAALRNQEQEFEEKTAIALKLLEAKPVQGGTYNVILNPSLGGVFAHEAFGHFSEADLIEDSPTMREKMRIGAALGNEAVSITDDPTMPDQLGFYRFDDEGVKARATSLLKDGVLMGRLHSRRTASAFGETLSGHCVAEDYRYAPIIRMGNIFIEPGRESFEDLLSRVDAGLYLVDHMGGQTSGENFTFGAQHGYLVEKGRLGPMIRDINVSGNLYRTLKNMVAVGDDLTLSKTGGCGKGQMNLRSCNGAPHVLVNEVIIGGQ